MRSSAIVLMLVAAAVIFFQFAQPLPLREGYNYSECRKRGFDREFCTVTPLHVAPLPKGAPS